MSRHIKFSLTLGAALLCALAMPTLAEGDGWWGGLDKGQNVKFADVLANPAAHRGKTLTFTCVFHKRDRVFDPLRSGFNAEHYDNIAVWPDGTSLWEQEVFIKDHPFLYLRKGHRQRDELMRLRRFTRLQITARLRSSVRGHPAFEVISFRPTGHRLGERAVRQMIRGDNLAKHGDVRSAARAYRDVLARGPDLPPVYELKVRKRLGDALREMGHPQEALKVEGGQPIEGSSPLPKNRRDPFQPGSDPFAPGPDRSAAPMDDATGSPDAGMRPPTSDTSGSPDGGLVPPASDTSGSPDGDASGSPDGLGTPPAVQPRQAPRPGAAPRGGERRARQVPGLPPIQDPNVRRGARRFPGTGDPGARPRRPAAQPKPELEPVRLPPGIPPKRTPRLSGVK